MPFSHEIDPTEALARSSIGKSVPDQQEKHALMMYSAIKISVGPQASLAYFQIRDQPCYYRDHHLIPHHQQG